MKEAVDDHPILGGVIAVSVCHSVAARVNKDHVSL
jgi:hypothetical protein